MNDIAARFKWQIYLVIAGLFFLFLMDFLLQITSQKFIFPDSVTYLIAAEKWYGDFSADELRPLIGAMVNGFPLLFGGSDEAVFKWSLCINIVCWLGVILMLFEVLRSFLLPKCAFLFSMVYIFCVGNAILVFHLLAESVFTFLLFAVFYLCKKYFDTQRFIFLSLATTVLVLSTMVKPASKILLVLFVIYFCRVLLKNWSAKQMRIVYGSVIILASQIGLMARQHGNFTISYIDTLAYYNYLGTRADGYKTGAEFKQFNNERSRYFGRLSYPEQKTVALEDFKNQVANNTSNLIKAYFTNVGVNAVGGSTAIEMCENIHDTSYFVAAKWVFKILAKLQNIFFSTFGAILAIFYLLKIKKLPAFVAFTPVFILYIIGISGVSSDQGDRFHLVIYPFVLILLAKFLSEKMRFLIYENH